MMTRRPGTRMMATRGMMIANQDSVVLWRQIDVPPNNRWSVWLMAVAAVGVFVGDGTPNTLMENKTKTTSLVVKFSNVPCLPRTDVSILTKNGRIILLVGAVNYSKESSDLVGSLIQQVRPQAVFLDINERVFRDFGIDKRVENRLAITDRDLWKKLILQPQVDNSDMALIPDHSKATMLSFLDPPVKESIQAVFSQLRMAGVQSGDKVDSWSHLVQALYEGLVLDVPIVLGGREYEIGAKRGEEVMQKTNRGEAARLVYRIRPTWKDDVSARENFRAIRQIIRDELPLFEQVMFEELDAHAARKVDALGQFDSLVAVVMMIHLDGVEQQLKELGWVQVEMW